MAHSEKKAAGRRAARNRRQARLRKKIVGTAEVPRLSVFRSNRHVFVQLVDDRQGITFASASTLEPELRQAEGDKTAKSRLVGELLARRAGEKGITRVVFDRGGCRYTGRVAAIAEAAREGGLQL